MIAPTMSAIKKWFREECPLHDDLDLANTLTGFSLGVWIGETHPGLMEKFREEMPEMTPTHEVMTRDLHEVLEDI